MRGIEIASCCAVVGTLLLSAGCSDATKRSSGPEEGKVVAAAAATPENESDAPAPAEEPPAGPVPDECGRYEVDVELPERHGCKEDADCSHTEHGPSRCTGPLCGGHNYAGRTEWVAAANQLYERVCTEAKFHQCERARCRAQKIEGVRCNKGTCELVIAAEPPQR